MRHIVILGLFLTLCACQPAGAPKQGEANEAPAANVSFRCEVKTDPQTDIPSAEVFVVINEQATKVANITACDVIEKDGYANFNIPNNAIAAAGGWWAGSGDYLYALQEGDKIVVKKGVVDEMSTQTEVQYATIATLPIPKN